MSVILNVLDMVNNFRTDVNEITLFILFSIKLHYLSTYFKNKVEIKFYYFIWNFKSTSEKQKMNYFLLHIHAIYNLENRAH